MEDHEGGGGNLGSMIVLTNWLPELVETQVDLITTTLTSILTTFTPPQQSVDDDGFKHHGHRQHHNSTAVALDDGGLTRTQTQKLGWKVGYGLMGAAYVGVVLSMVMVLAVVVGVMMVNHYVEQPVLVKQRLYFDYTDVNPQAAFVFGAGGVPVGHTFHVSVVLLVPESDYNRDIGVFQPPKRLLVTWFAQLFTSQLTAEVMSTNGRLIARSSQPSMLQFHSYPIRLMRTFIMGIPILLGISHETQKIKVQMLRYKEDSIVRTDAVKITLMARAGTLYLPQVYEAEILMHSKLPRVKELVHNWKWTFYVWTSLYIYAVLLILLLCFFRTLLLFPMIPRASERRVGREAEAFEREEKPEVRAREGREVSETLRKWQQYRRKRKAALLSRNTFMESNVFDPMSSSSYTVSKDSHSDIFSTVEDDVGDSESVCKGG